MTRAEAIQQAREALAAYRANSTRHYIDEALEDVLAALDAARGEAVAWPKADDSDKELGWSWDYKWLESLADATRAAGWDASMEALDFVLSRLAAQQPAAAVPDGYALVPVEPTEAMLDAGHASAWRRIPSCFDMTDAEIVYRAMLAANKENGNG